MTAKWLYIFQLLIVIKGLKASEAKTLNFTVAPCLIKSYNTHLISPGNTVVIIQGYGQLNWRGKQQQQHTQKLSKSRKFTLQKSKQLTRTTDIAFFEL